MADAYDYFFNEPLKLSFTQNEFRCGLREAPAVLYWFPPGTRVLVEAWTQADKRERGPALNDIVDWNKVGYAMTFTGMEGESVHLNEDNPPNYPAPWNGGTYNIGGRYTVMQADNKGIDGGAGTYPQNLYGKWANQPLTGFITQDYLDESAGPPSYAITKQGVGPISLNTWTSVKAIENRVFMADRPQQLAYSEILDGTGCFDITETDEPFIGFTCVRTTVLAVTPDNVTYRSIMPQIVRGGGFIAFGYGRT